MLKRLLKEKFKNIIFYPKYYHFIIYLICVFLFCEYFIYYFVLGICSWPSGTTKASVRAMLLADPHLLGNRQGHWFDKLRREWQMHRAYVTALDYFEPDAVFVLGDLFDEAQWAKSDEFASYVSRFRSLFPPKRSLLYAVPGNHDLGFHYAMIPERSVWFKNAFGADSVELISVNHIHFILINSMSMANDGCSFCEESLAKLKEINRTLDCYKNQIKSHFCNIETAEYYSKPIIIQHFPLYRKSDKMCNEPDEAPSEEKSSAFRENWECLSESSSKMLLNYLQPRAAFSGHTHHGCLTYHTRERIPEYTVSSFSWRNKQFPAFHLATFTSDSMAVNKCYMPQETTVIGVYLFSGFLLILWLFSTCFRPLSTKNYCYYDMCIGKEFVIYLKTKNPEVWARCEVDKTKSKTSSFEVTYTDFDSYHFVSLDAFWNEIEPGNALCFTKSHSLIIHYATCVEKYEKEMLVIHNPGNVVQLDTYDESIVEAYDALAIYKCEEYVNSPLCKAISIRRAFEKINGREIYDLFHQNCEHAASSIHSPIGGFNSTQVYLPLLKIARFFIFLFIMLIEIFLASCNYRLTSFFGLVISFFSLFIAYFLCVLFGACIEAHRTVLDTLKVYTERWQNILTVIKSIKNVAIKQILLDQNLVQNLEEGITTLLLLIRDHPHVIIRCEDIVFHTHQLILQYWASHYKLTKIANDNDWNGDVDDLQISGIKKIHRYIQQKDVSAIGLEIPLRAYVFEEYIFPILIKLPRSICSNMSHNTQQKRLGLALVNFMDSMEENLFPGKHGIEKFVVAMRHLLLNDGDVRKWEYLSMAAKCCRPLVKHLSLSNTNQTETQVQNDVPLVRKMLHQTSPYDVVVVDVLERVQPFLEKKLKDIPSLTNLEAMRNPEVRKIVFENYFFVVIERIKILFIHDVRLFKTYVLKSKSNAKSFFK